MTVRTFVKILQDLGFDPTVKKGTVSTPERWMKAITEFTQGEPDVAAIMKDGFEPAENPGIVVQSNIPFRMLCEHHLFPAHGRAHIGYIPRKTMTGLSKLVRIVDAFCTAAPSTQEIITSKIGMGINQYLEPQGIAVIVEASHTCIDVRGIHAPGVITKTSFMHGVFLTNPAAREEFMSLL